VNQTAINFFKARYATQGPTNPRGPSHCPLVGDHI